MSSAQRKKQKLYEIIKSNSGDWVETTPAITGNIAGVVEAGNGEIWVRLGNARERKVLNNLSVVSKDRHVLIGRSKIKPTVWQLVEIRDTYINDGKQNEYASFGRAQYEESGANRLTLSRKQIADLSVRVKSAFVVSITGGVIRTISGAMALIDNQDLNLSSYVPATGAKYINIESNSSGVLSVNTTGVNFGTIGAADISHVPVPAAGYYRIATIMLYELQAALLDSDISVPQAIEPDYQGLKTMFDTDADGIVDFAESVPVTVRNSTGSTIAKGKWVYYSGVTGNRPNISLAKADAESTSYVAGMVIADIPNNTDGQIVVAGTRHNVDLSAFLDNDRLWLSATTAGDATATRPTAPNQAVFLGVVARAHATQGRIILNIYHGFEVDELDDVLFTGLANDDFIQRKAGLWKNRTVTQVITDLVDTDGTLAANSDTRIASQKATKTYADNVSSNASVIAKVLTGFIAGAGTVSATDSILQAFQKVVGNIALKLTANTTITGATKTKITYDANGLVTAGTDAAYVDLTGRPKAETSAVDIFYCNNPGGNSAFVGTIATLPGGATLTYNISSGNEGAMVPLSTSQLAKMRLYNTTRGTYALISNCVTGTNTITLTANVPVGWTVGDTIDIASQTVAGGSLAWVDLEITSGLTDKTNVFINAAVNSVTVGDALRIHPFTASYSNTKFVVVPDVLVSGRQTQAFGLLPITGNVFSIAWLGSVNYVQIRESGYLE